MKRAIAGSLAEHLLYATGLLIWTGSRPAIASPIEHEMSHRPMGHGTRNVQQDSRGVAHVGQKDAEGVQPGLDYCG